MRVIVSTPKDILYEGNAQGAVLSAEDGEVCVMDSHQDFMCALRVGAVRILDPEEMVSEKWQFSDGDAAIKINGGVAKAFKNELVVLVET
jgi:F0F1-type ATP synthase epsilon subunit